VPVFRQPPTCYVVVMSAAERLLSEVLALPIAERAKLAHHLLESLESAADDQLDAVWLEELQKRAHDVSSRAVELIPWQTARDNIMTELKKRRAARHTP